MAHRSAAGLGVDTQALERPSAFAFEIWWWNIHFSHRLPTLAAGKGALLSPQKDFRTRRHNLPPRQLMRLCEGCGICGMLASMYAVSDGLWMQESAGKRRFACVAWSPREVGEVTKEAGKVEHGSVFVRSLRCVSCSCLFMVRWTANGTTTSSWSRHQKCTWWWRKS